MLSLLLLLRLLFALLEFRRAKCWLPLASPEPRLGPERAIFESEVVEVRVHWYAALARAVDTVFASAVKEEGSEMVVGAGRYSSARTMSLLRRRRRRYSNSQCYAKRP